MPEHCLIDLDASALKLAAIIMKNVADVFTPQAAVVWALQQASATLPNADAAADFIVEGTVGTSQSAELAHIPLGERHLLRHQSVKLPNGLVLSLHRDTVLGADTLKSLVPNEEHWARLLDGAVIGKFKR